MRCSSPGARVPSDHVSWFATVAGLAIGTLSSRLVPAWYVKPAGSASITCTVGTGERPTFLTRIV